MFRILFVVEKWHENLLENTVHMLKSILGDLHKDENVSHGFFGNLVLLHILAHADFVHQFQDHNGLFGFDPFSTLIIGGLHALAWVCRITDQLFNIFAFKEGIQSVFICFLGPVFTEL